MAWRGSRKRQAKGRGQGHWYDFCEQRHARNAFFVLTLRVSTQPLSRLAALLRIHGIRETARILQHRVSERFQEWRFGMSSSEVVPLSRFGVSDPRFHEYVPTSYRTFRQAMLLAEVKPDDVFVDYGSGMGRAVVLAATYPFAKVVGVELVPELNAIAEQNLAQARARNRLRCSDVELITADATRFIPPPEATQLFFYNPFSEEILCAVLENVRPTFQERTLIYISPSTDTRMDRIAHRFPWLVETRREARVEGGTVTVYRARVIEPVAAESCEEAEGRA
jgi:SAM-dependent methyltransferase